MVSVSFGAFRFHPDRRQLLRDDVEVRLTRKAFDLLTLLIERGPAVVPKLEIHERLWPGTFVSDATLLGLVKELRRALSDRNRALIRTAHGVGYAFTAVDSDAGARTEPGITCWLVAGTRRIALRHGSNVIGRDPASAVWVDVSGVSRRHARITVEDGVASVEDLGSKNGTLVRDRPLTGRLVLCDADRIQVATELLVFRTSDTGISTATNPITA